MISPFIRSVVNQSFFERIFSKSPISVQITPLMGKFSLDHNVAESYRPISSQPVLSNFWRDLFSTES